MSLYGNIVFTTDFSGHSIAAFDHAKALADSFGGHITLLHVIDPSVHLAVSFQAHIPTVQVDGDWSAKARDFAKKKFDELFPADVRSKYKLELNIVEGTPFVEIIKFAKDKKADLIVMATHGLTGLKHLLIGSTAEKVVRKSPCPVLTVRPEGQEFEAF
ncbi:MAG: universal stress protein [Planctomycetes bacterium]|nr:universal stress protein [Planctomycetota bacterium]